jgi:hypothetical protein
MATLSLSPKSLWCCEREFVTGNAIPRLVAHSGLVGSSAHEDCEACDRSRQHAFWECAIAQTVRTQVQRDLGLALKQICLSNGTCGWLPAYCL